jgi:hypothetical protein
MDPTISITENKISVTEKISLKLSDCIERVKLNEFLHSL